MKIEERLVQVKEEHDDIRDLRTAAYVYAVQKIARYYEEYAVRL